MASVSGKSEILSGLSLNDCVTCWKSPRPKCQVCPSVKWRIELKGLWWSHVSTKSSLFSFRAYGDATFPGLCPIILDRGLRWANGRVRRGVSDSKPRSAPTSSLFFHSIVLIPWAPKGVNGLTRWRMTTQSITSHDHHKPLFTCPTWTMMTQHWAFTTWLRIQGCQLSQLPTLAHKISQTPLSHTVLRFSWSVILSLDYSPLLSIY